MALKILFSLIHGKNPGDAGCYIFKLLCYFSHMEEEFMELAISEAKKSQEHLKCGAVIVKGKEAIVGSSNTQRADCDASAHAEINAIRMAGEKLGNKNLKDCTIYSTCEPCPMCLAAISFAKIPWLVYGSNLAEVSDKKHNIQMNIDEFLERLPDPPKVVKNFMKKECDALVD